MISKNLCLMVGMVIEINDYLWLLFVWVGYLICFNDYIEIIS